MRTLLKSVLVTAFATGVAAALLPGLARGDSRFPSKPIRMVSGSAGSQTDIVTRLIGSKLSESLGQPVVVENRPGAGGTIGAALVAKATPDGHTLLLQSSQFVINAALQPSLPYDPLRDLAGVTQIGFSTVALVVAPSLGIRSTQDLVSSARAKPGRMFYSSTGAGSGMHMNGERFRLSTGINVVHVGFKGAPEALIEVMAGRVHYSLPGLGPALPLIKDGKLIALAVVAPQRSPLLPDVPAIGEVLPGYQKDGSYGLMAPARTPRPIVSQISAEVGRILGLPDVKAKLQNMGFAPAPTTPDEYDRIRRADIETFTKIGKLAGLRGQ